MLKCTTGGARGVGHISAFVFQVVHRFAHSCSSSGFGSPVWSSLSYPIGHSRYSCELANCQGEIRHRHSDWILKVVLHTIWKLYMHRTIFCPIAFLFHLNSRNSYNSSVLLVTPVFYFPPWLLLVLWQVLFESSELSFMTL